MTLVPLDLRTMRIEGGTQMRATVSMEHVADLRAVLEAGGTLPPVRLVHDMEERAYWIVDGYHRISAYLGLAKVPPNIEATVTRGTRDDAVWLACAANLGHGLRRTSDDKRMVVRAALAHRMVDELDLSDRAIAEHCGVSPNFVGDMRRAMQAEALSQLSSEDSCTPKPAKRRGRDGRIRSLPKPPKVPAEAKVGATLAEVFREPEQPRVVDVARVAAVDRDNGVITLTGEVSGGSNRDALGQPIPEALGVPWQRLTARTNIVLAGLKEARAGVAALKTLTASNPKALDSGQRDALHRFGADLDAMMVRAEGYRPHAVCVDGPCSRCKGRGWMTKAEHLAMVRGQEAKR